MSTLRYKRKDRFGMNLPLVQFAFLTGELPNPWRCGSCATRSQIRQASNLATRGEVIGFKICRKCGLDL